eukprot:3153366-Prorocentrum_lima.AAC.1
MEGRKSHALDVSVAVTSTPNAAAQKSRAAGANVTIDGRVQEKRHRYPEHALAPSLHVFAVDEGGNLAERARQMLRRYAKRDAAGSP